MTRHRPWLRLKTAASLDGCTALANGVSQWITGPAARADVQRWRARACAILTGVGTVRADDPQMNVRDLDIGRQPLRVIVDSHLNTPPGARILGAGTLVVGCADDPDRQAALQATGAEVIVMPPGPGGRVDLPLLLAELARRGCNEVHAEAGASLNGALLQAGMVDEWLAYLAPMAMGNPSRGLFEVPELAEIAGCARFKPHDLRQFGDDIRLTLRPA
jgi:diaminohydroxyphosphoribosylaminopyrimidine deaminase/5-amino-6-(5-phosphoribosylamino)uracil reductase